MDKSVGFGSKEKFVSVEWWWIILSESRSEGITLGTGGVGFTSDRRTRWRGFTLMDDPTLR